MKISTKIFIGFSVIIILSIINSYVNYQLNNQVKTNSEFLNRSEQIIQNSNKISRGISEMQNGFRGFLLTENEEFLESYHQGIIDLPILFKEQRELIRNSTRQWIKLDSIYLLHQLWVDYANRLIYAKKRIKDAESKLIYENLLKNQLQKQVGKKLNDLINIKFLQFDKLEYKVRQNRRISLVESINNTQRLSFALAVLTILIGFSSSIYILRIISQRIASMVKIAETISKGEFKNIEDKKKDELKSLSDSLNIMSSTLNKNFTELEKKNKDLDQFAYVVSHDLKAPLRGMYNVIQWIEEDHTNELSPQVVKYLHIFTGRIERLENLINGLLEYARIGRVKKTKETVDTNLLVKEAVELVVPKDFTVNLKNLPVIQTEKLRLEQVFINLLSNSVKYRSEGNGSISIDCRSVNDRFYEFSFKDNGIGIDPEFHEKIFVMFQTLREKYAKESTGVGLAIVKKVIEEHHGTIKVISSLGKGATFVFTWPK